MSTKTLCILTTAAVDLTSLRGIVANQIHEIRRLRGPESASKYGIRYGSGAIDVRAR